MNVGWWVNELEREEAAARALSRHRAEKAREQRRVTSRGTTSVGRGSRRTMTRQEAIELLLKRGHVKGALKLQSGRR
jgi:predicted ATPase